MIRISDDEYGLRIADVAAQLGTCLRRKVGCVLLDDRGRTLSTGRNGRPRGLVHCNKRFASQLMPYQEACKSALAASGVDLDGCEAVHAEQNALMFCADVDRIHTCYVTVSPCVTCVKMLMNTGCQRVVFRERYAHDAAAEDLWLKSPGKKEWIHAV